MEYFDVINENGSPTGKTKLRKDVHRDGDWHRAIDIWILNSKNELLLQKRSLQKESYPGLWEVSCSGHISAGEESRLSALRELEEELGIKIDPEDLQFIFEVKESHITNNGTFINNEIKDVYLVQKDFDLNTLNLQTEEVSAVRWVNYQDLKQDLQNSPQIYVQHEAEYARLFEYLDQHFDSDRK